MMKRMRGCCTVLACLLLLMTCLSFGATAAEKREAEPLSPALTVLAAQNEMSVATLSGNDYYFSEDVFARTLNLREIEAITVVSLPDVTAGELMMGSERVSVGQRIRGEELQLLSFVAKADDVAGAAFTFSPAGGAYEMVCNIHVLEEVNESPTVSMASEAALQVSTHRDFVGYGQLSAYDPEGDALIFEVVSAPRDGVVVMTDRARGAYVYLPREGFVGEDRFCYVARDAYGNYSAMAEVSVTVSESATSIVYADMVGRREYNAALSMTEAGIMRGEQSGKVWNFYPDVALSRGEFVMMAMQAMGVGSLPQVSDTGFDDNEQIDPQIRPYVAAARELGYIEGVVDAAGRRTFAASQSVTRAEAAVILNRMLGGETERPVATVPTFADGDDIPAWASEAITALTLKGILAPIDGAITPGATVTRADAACMLSALMQQN